MIFKEKMTIFALNLRAQVQMLTDFNIKYDFALKKPLISRQNSSNLERTHPILLYRKSNFRRGGGEWSVHESFINYDELTLITLWPVQ